MQKYGAVQTVRRTVLPFVPGLPGYTYTNSEASAYVAAMTSLPNDTRKGQIDTLIGALKSASLWATIDVLTLFAAHDAQASTINAKDPTKLWVPTNSPVFTTDRGYTGDGVSKHLVYPDLYSALTNYQQNSGTLSFGVRSVTRGAAAWVFGANGASSGSGFLMNTTLAIPRVNSTGVGNGPDPGASGRYIITRNASTGADQYLNGSLQGSVVVASVAKSTNNPATHRNNTSFSNAELSYALIASGWDATKAAAFDAAISAYLTAVGA